MVGGSFMCRAVIFVYLAGKAGAVISFRGPESTQV